MTGLYVQYGCGTIVNDRWMNFDASPTLFLQKVPLLGKLVRPWLNTVFPDAAIHGDIVDGLPIPDDSVDGVFCSHVLEHLSLENFYIALRNTFRVLKPGGVFRCILPDLEIRARNYVDAITSPHLSDDRLGSTASIRFVESLNMASTKKRDDVRSLLSVLFGRSGHLWMWDKYSLTRALADQGFVEIEPFVQNQCEDQMFLLLEQAYQFEDAIALQCRKPLRLE